MRRWNLSSGDGTGLAVRGPARPALRWEVTAGGRMLLRQRRRPIMLATVDRCHYGVYVYRVDGFTSPLPPIRADQARRMPPHDDATWASRWAYRIAGHLGASRSGPLHTGDWLLRTASLPPYTLTTDLVRAHPATYLDWFGSGWSGVVPLRRLPAEQDGRVHAHRKLAADGVLPPVVLWWISGLDGYVLLDGHARLVAARAEGISPPVLLLSAALDRETQQAVLDGMTVGHTVAMAHVDRQVAANHPGARRAAANLSTHFAAQAAAVPTWPGRTTAWPLPGGVAAWETTASREAPGWPGAVPRPEPPD